MKKVEDYVVSIPDFPEPGIIFRDVTSVRHAGGVQSWKALCAGAQEGKASAGDRIHGV